MPPVPKKKHTRRRSNIRKNAPAKRGNLVNLVKCPNCGKKKEMHKECPHCGFYK